MVEDRKTFKFNSSDVPTLEEVPRDDDLNRVGYKITCGSQEVYLTGVQLGILLAQIRNMGDRGLI